MSEQFESGQCWFCGPLARCDGRHVRVTSSADPQPEQPPDDGLDHEGYTMAAIHERDGCPDGEDCRFCEQPEQATEGLVAEVKWAALDYLEKWPGDPVAMAALRAADALTRLTEENARLQKRLARLEAADRNLIGPSNVEALEAAERRARELRGALEPFAMFADTLSDEGPDDSIIAHLSRKRLTDGELLMLTYGDIRRAARTLSETSPQNEPDNP